MKNKLLRLWWDIRNWLLKRLAGKSVIMINARVRGSVLMTHNELGSFYDLEEIQVIDGHPFICVDPAVSDADIEAYLIQYPTREGTKLNKGYTPPNTEVKVRHGKS